MHVALSLTGVGALAFDITESLRVVGLMLQDLRVLLCFIGDSGLRCSLY